VRRLPLTITTLIAIAAAAAVAAAPASARHPPLIKEFALPPGVSPPFGIARGLGGDMWFSAGDFIGRISYDGDVVTYQVPTANALLGSVTRGPQGKMWFTERDGNKLGRIDRRGRIQEFPISTPDSVPQAIVFDRAGTPWYTASEDVNAIARLNADGSVTEFPVPTLNARPQGMVLGPDDALWFTERIGKIGRFDPATSSFREYPLAPAQTRSALPSGPTRRSGSPTVLPPASDASPRKET
jgi:virginiamycin B lyase